LKVKVKSGVDGGRAAMGVILRGGGKAVQVEGTGAGF
jgi:hypothetical protein